MSRSMIVRAIAVVAMGGAAMFAEPRTAQAFEVCDDCVFWTHCTNEEWQNEMCELMCGDEFYSLGCGPASNCDEGDKELVCVDWES